MTWQAILLGYGLVHLVCGVLTWGWVIAYIHKWRWRPTTESYLLTLALSIFGPFSLYVVWQDARKEDGQPWRHGWKAW